MIIACASVQAAVRPVTRCKLTEFECTLYMSLRTKIKSTGGHSGSYVHVCARLLCMYLGEAAFAAASSVETGDRGNGPHLDPPKRGFKLQQVMVGWAPRFSTPMEAGQSSSKSRTCVIGTKMALMV